MSLENSLSEFIAGLEVREPTRAGGVTVYPLFNAGKVGPSYTLLADALARDVASVEEKGSGSVPVLVLINKSETLVLVTQGDELVGGKQDRIANISLLAPPKSVIDLPVSCVEQRRWHSVSRKFAHGEKAFFKLRHALHRQVVDSLRERGAAMSDQASVWDAVDAELSSAAPDSSTRAMRDAHDGRRASLEELERRLQYVEGASGLACAVGGRVVFAEVFDRPDPCRSAWPRLVRSLAFEPAAQEDGAPEVTRDAVRLFLDEVTATRAEEFPSPGVGADIKLTAGRVSGSALRVEETVVHCSLFTNEEI